MTTLIRLKILPLFQNMIYRIQENSDQCPQCSKHRIRQDRDSSSSSDNEGGQRMMIPLKKNVLKQNQNIQTALNLLHQQVEELKNENKQKEKQIRQLLARLQEKSSISSAYFSNQIKYEEPKSNRKVQNKSEDSQYFTHQKQKPKNNGSSKALNQVNYIENKISQISEFKNERVKMLEKEIEEYRGICEELQSRLDLEVQNTEWMSQFCLSFCNMANQLSRMQGQTVMRPNTTLRQNTKRSWKFFKLFVNQVLE